MTSMTSFFSPHLIMILIVAIAAIAGIVSIKYLGNDNPVEKVAEEIIKDETGLSVDLTPPASPTATSSSPLGNMPSQAAPPTPTQAQPTSQTPPSR